MPLNPSSNTLRVFKATMNKLNTLGIHVDTKPFKIRSISKLELMFQFAWLPMVQSVFQGNNLLKFKYSKIYLTSKKVMLYLNSEKVLFTSLF